MREGLVTGTGGVYRYASTLLAPSIMTWAGIWNMVWVAGLTLRKQGVTKCITVRFAWERGGEISLEARGRR